MRLHARRTPAPAPPRVESMTDAVALANQILGRLQPGPESVTAFPPDYEVVYRRDEGWYDLDPGRAAKMQHIRHLVEDELYRLKVLHKMPAIQLIAEDGAVATLWNYRSGQLSTRSRRRLEEDIKTASAAIAEMNTG